VTVVVSFQDFTPPPRFDAVPWATARIEEASTISGTYTAIDTVTLSPADTDPSLPQARSFTTDQGTALDLWYRVVFIDGAANESEPTGPVQNGVITTYTTTDELARVLKVRSPSAAQTAAMNRVLQTAAGEINSEIDLAEGVELSGWELQLAAEVNLERAVEHWRQEESPFGLIGLGAELGSAFTSKDSWERHALKLAPLKGQWGFA
jgi:hypothetical protein